MNKKLYQDKQSVSLSIEKRNGEMILKNDVGNEWIFPSNVSEASAIATLVYSTILHKKEYIESFADNYTISVEIEEKKQA